MKKNIEDEEVLEVINEKYMELFPAEKKVVDAILKKPQNVVNYNVADLAKKSDVSVATIVRLCHHLGYEGYYQFRLLLSRDLGKKQHRVRKSGNAFGSYVEELADSVLAIGKRLDLGQLREVLEVLKNAPMVHLIACGNATNVSRYMGFRLERLGIRCTYSELPEYSISHINLANEDEVVVAISKSGISKRVIDGMTIAKGKDMKVIAITASLKSEVAKLADYVLNSSVRQETFDFYNGYSYFNEYVIVDTVLNFMVNQELLEAEMASESPSAEEKGVMPKAVGR